MTQGLHKTADGSFLLVYARDFKLVTHPFSQEEIMNEACRFNLVSGINDKGMYRLEYSQHAGVMGNPMHYIVQVDFDELVFSKEMLGNLIEQAEYNRLHWVTKISKHLIKEFMTGLYQVEGEIVKLGENLNDLSRQLKCI